MAMRRVRLHPLAVLAASLGVCVTSALGQSSTDALRDRLQDKSFFLRGMYIEDKLKFDATGAPDKPYKTGSFTVCGFRVEQIKLSGDHLRLSGVRLAEHFDERGAPHLVDLTVDPQRTKNEPITIEIDKHGQADFTPALDAIFADSIAPLAQNLPEYWQHYARSIASGNTAPPRRRPCQRAQNSDDAIPDDPHLDSANFPPPCFQRSANGVGSGGSGGSTTVMRPPHVVHMVDPEFSEYARKAKISGNVQVSLLVEPDGTTSHIQIVRPVGFGLDEQAVKAVSRYQFDPAVRDGVPVRTALFVDVNFQIF